MIIKCFFNQLIACVALFICLNFAFIVTANQANRAIISLNPPTTGGQEKLSSFFEIKIGHVIDVLNKADIPHDKKKALLRVLKNFTSTVDGATINEIGTPLSASVSHASAGNLNGYLNAIVEYTENPQTKSGYAEGALTHLRAANETFREITVEKKVEAVTHNQFQNIINETLTKLADVVEKANFGNADEKTAADTFVDALISKADNVSHMRLDGELKKKQLKVVEGMFDYISTMASYVDKTGTIDDARAKSAFKNLVKTCISTNAFGSSFSDFIKKYPEYDPDNETMGAEASQGAYQHGGEAHRAPSMIEASSESESGRMARTVERDRIQLPKPSSVEEPR